MGRGAAGRSPYAARISSPQTVCKRSRPTLSLPLFTVVVKPTASGRLRRQEHSVVSWSTRIGPSRAAIDLGGAVIECDTVSANPELASFPAVNGDRLVGLAGDVDLALRPT